MWGEVHGVLDSKPLLACTDPIPAGFESFPTMSRSFDVQLGGIVDCSRN